MLLYTRLAKNGCAMLRSSLSQLINITETLQILDLYWALIRFICSIRVREIWVNENRVNDFRVKAGRSVEVK